MKYHSQINRFASLTCASLLVAMTAPAQYPRLTSEISAEANRRKAEADRRSDEAFARVLPDIQAWAAKGRPYQPGAAGVCIPLAGAADAFLWSTI
jgi:hypothetical protein